MPMLWTIASRQSTELNGTCIALLTMADRGLFSYDVETYPTPDTHYFRVAIPKQPLRFLDLPTKVRKVLARTTLSSSSLEECSTIPYLTTLNL